MPDLKFWFRSANQEALQRYVISLLSRRRRQKVSAIQQFNMNTVTPYPCSYHWSHSKLTHLAPVCSYWCCHYLSLHLHHLFTGNDKTTALISKANSKVRVTDGFSFSQWWRQSFVQYLLTGTNRHLCLCITQFMNACLNTKLLTTGSKTN